MKALGDVSAIVTAAAVGFVAWLVYKLVKGAGPKEPVIEHVSGVGEKVRLTARITKPAQAGIAERQLLGGTYPVEAVVSNRGDNAATVELLFEATETPRIIGASSTATASVNVSLAAGESKSVKVDMQSQQIVALAPVDTTLQLFAVSGGQRQSIALPVSYVIE